MKLLTMITLLFSVSLFAKEEMKETNFAEAKTRMLKHMDDRITALKKHRECVSAASDRAAMKACRTDMKDLRQEWKSERRTWKKERKQKRMQMRDQKRAERKEKAQAN
jgi:hypothetical protein